MPSVSTNICSDFSAAPGTGVTWTNAPPGTSITQSGNSAWPFNVGPPIHLPAPMTVMVKEGLPEGTYYFLPSCCKGRVSVKVK